VNKPFHSVDQMLALLESRGVATDEETQTILQRENYYSVINGYKELFFTDDVALPGTTFSEIYCVFTFDRNLRLFLLPWIMQVESMMKTVVAHKASEHYLNEPEFYLNIRNYDTGPSALENSKYTLNRLKRCRERDRPALNHYRNQIGHVPLWVLVGFLTFGELSHFFSALNSRSVKSSITKTVAEITEWSGTQKLTIERLEAYLWALADFRNICAHDERLYCQKIARVRTPNRGGTDVASLTEIVYSMLPPEYKSDFQDSLNKLFTDFEKSGAVRNQIVREIMLQMGYE
jgi:abortive infection bacteriophage resistance protein